MKKLVALLLSVMMCFACVSALADTYVSWYTYGDVYLSSVRSEMEADFAKLNLTINGSDANGNQQVQSDFISTALMNNDCEAIVVNLVESGAISTAQHHHDLFYCNTIHTCFCLYDYFSVGCHINLHRCFKISIQSGLIKWL